MRLRRSKDARPHKRIAMSAPLENAAASYFDPNPTIDRLSLRQQTAEDGIVNLGESNARARRVEAADPRSRRFGKHDQMRPCGGPGAG